MACLSQKRKTSEVGAVSKRSVKREEAEEGRGPDLRASYTGVRSLGFILSTS